MKTKKLTTTALGTLLTLAMGILALGFCGSTQAAEMAAFDALPSLDAQITKPTAVAVDAAGRVYVAEALNNRVRVFSQGGGLLATLNGLVKPSCVAVDAAGRLYVGSAWKGNVAVYDGALRELFELGSGQGEFVEPADIDIDGSGQVYVVDTQKNQVLVYNGSGQFVKAIGSQGNGNGQFNHPASLAIDGASSELVVLDRKQIFDGGSQSWIDGARIQYLTPDGTFVRGYDKFGYDLNHGQLVMPVQVAVDSTSRVYVTDTRAQKVLVYDNTDTFLGLIDNHAEPLRIPMGLSLSPSNRLYVASLLSGRVNVFGIDSYSAMDIAPAALSFSATEGGNAPVPQAATITNSGKNDLAWNATTSTAWLTLPATAGSVSPAGTGPVTVEVNTAGLTPGEYKGSIQVTAPGITEEVAVALTVKSNPLQVSPVGLTFTASQGTTPAAQTMNIAGGSEPLTWSASADQAWLTLSKSGGSTPDALKVYANATGLTEGNHEATITVNNKTNGGSVKIAVSLTISATTTPPAETPSLPEPGKGVKSGGKMWSVVQPVPGMNLRGVWGSSVKSILAVGDGGTVLQYDGRDWTTMNSGTGAILRSVWGSGTADAYTVGDGGAALHFDGKSWTAVGTGTEESLLDVWGADAADVLAAGMLGTIFEQTFTGAPYPAGVALRSLWGSAASDVFAVGENGAVLHNDGTGWTPMPSGTSQWLNGVWGSSATDVFAVGEGGTIIHYDGATWTTMESGVTETLHGVYGKGPNDLFAVGDNGVVLHYDGTAWKALLTGGVNLRDVWLTGRLVVAVGDDGTILTGNAGSFPWNITTRNIALISSLKKLERKKAEAAHGLQPGAATKPHGR